MPKEVQRRLNDAEAAGEATRHSGYFQILFSSIPCGNRRIKDIHAVIQNRRMPIR
jgi:hypothetical protein